MKIHISQEHWDHAPDDVWNGFINIISSKPHEISIDQLPAHLVFVYESEVQNGGHLQYFENGHVSDVDATLESLRKLHAPRHAEILKMAHDLYRRENRPPATTKEDYIAEALEDRYGQLDVLFAACTPDLISLLKKHLTEHQELYFEVAE